MTSSPSFRMKISGVENWYYFGSRTAWLRLVMNTLAVRGMSTPSSWYAIDVRIRQPRA